MKRRIILSALALGILSPGHVKAADAVCYEEPHMSVVLDGSKAAQVFNFLWKNNPARLVFTKAPNGARYYYFNGDEMFCTKTMIPDKLNPKIFKTTYGCNVGMNANGVMGKIRACQPAPGDGGGGDGGDGGGDGGSGGDGGDGGGV